MLNDKFLNISEFALIAGVSRQTLIYYDKIGLFHPAYTAENGYRVYAHNQVNLISIITILRDLGLPLKKIKQVVANLSPQRTTGVLKTQLAAIEKKLEELTALKNMIEVRLNQIECGNAVKECLPNFCIEELTEDVPFYYGKEINSAQGDIDDQMIIDFLEQAEKKGVPMIFAFCHVKEFENIKGGNEDVVCRIGFRLKGEKYANGRMPAGKYLVGYAKGDYGKTNYVYKELLAYAQSNGYAPKGYVYEEYLIDELAQKNPDEYILQISVRIE